MIVFAMLGDVVLSMLVFAKGQSCMGCGVDGLSEMRHFDSKFDSECERA